MNETDGTLVLKLPSEVDASVVVPVTREAREKMRAPGLHTLIVDLGDVVFLDSLGLGLLVNLRALADDRGASWSLRDVPPKVAQILELTGLLGHLSAE